MPSCQVVSYRDRLMMVDCGEGAQLMMRKMHMKFSRLTDIFISHLHGDHFLGLPGLLSTMGLHQREGALTVHCFEAGLDVLRHVMRVFCPDPGYEIVYHPIKYADEVIVDTPSLTVETVRMAHRVPCVGFVFREKPKLRHIKGDMARFYQVPHYQMDSLRAGADFVTADGEVIANGRLTGDPDPSLSYACLADTTYKPDIVGRIAGVDLLYHEATYDATVEAKAVSRGHSTASQAAMIARDAGVGRLIIGHFSKQYEGDESLLLEQARAIFPNTILAKEGMTIDV